MLLVLVLAAADRPAFMVRCIMIEDELSSEKVRRSSCVGRDERRQAQKLPEISIMWRPRLSC